MTLEHAKTLLEAMAEVPPSREARDAVVSQILRSIAYEYPADPHSLAGAALRIHHLPAAS
jgi:hypothetical protein